MKIADRTIKMKPRIETVRMTTFVEGSEEIREGATQEPETSVISLPPSQLFA